MWLDDLFLRLQRGLDRVVRRARVGTPPERTGRRFIVVQIDGLAATVLDRAPELALAFAGPLGRGTSRGARKRSCRAGADAAAAIARAALPAAAPSPSRLIARPDSVEQRLSPSSSPPLDQGRGGVRSRRD